MNNKTFQSESTKQRFALRKLSVGVVSVLVGLTFISGNAKSAKADANSQAAGSPVTEDSSNSPQAAATTALQTKQSVSLSTPHAATPVQAPAKQAPAASSTAAADTHDRQAPASQAVNQVNTNLRAQAATVTPGQAGTTTAPTDSTASQYNTGDWVGELNQATHEFTLTKYQGSDQTNVHIPNTSDFIKAGVIASGDKVYISKDLLHSLAGNAVSLTIDDAGAEGENKLYIKGDISGTFSWCSKLTNLDAHSLDTSGATSTVGMFSGDTTLKVANLAGWDLRNVTAMGWMFDRTQNNMQKLILDNWQLNPDADTQQMFSYAFPKEVSVTGMKNINSQILGAYVNSFRITSTLTSIDLSSTTLSPKVQSLMFAFRNLSHVKSINLSGWDISQVTDLNSMFINDTAVESINLNGWDFRNAKGLGGAMFYGCNNLKTLDLGNAKFADLPNVTNNDAFGYVSNITKVNLDGAENVPSYLLQEFVVAARNSHAATIDLSTFSISRQITNMFGLFANLPAVETINVTNLNTDNVTNMSYMFSNDPHLTQIVGLNALNTSKVTNMAGMLAQNPGLTNVDLSGLDTTKLTDISHLFDGDQNLAKLNLSGWVFQEGIKDDAVFQNALGKLTALDLTNAKTVPAAVLNAYVAVARNTKAKDIDLSTFSTSRQITNMFGLFANLPVVETINVTNLNTDNVTNMSYMFSNDPHLTKIIGLNTLNTSKVTNMAGMLAQNPSLANVDLSGLDTTKLTDISHLFDGDQNLAKLNLSGWVFQEGIKDDDTFQKALDKLTALDLTNTKTIPAAVLRAYVAVARNTKAKDIDLSTLSISRQITDMSGLFADLPAVETINVANLNTGNVTDMSYMFNNDPQLTQIIGVGGFDTHNVTNMNSMFGAYHYNTVNNDEPLGLTYFGRLKELDLSNWDTSKVTDMGFMFSGQQSLTKIGQLANWQTSQVTDMGDMFEALAALPDDQLTNLNWDTSKVENMWSMFYDMPLQKDLSFVNNWNTANVRNMSYMFAEDPNLTRLDLSKWDVGKVGTDQPGQNYSLAAMFADDRALTSVGDISHWNTANVHDTRYMFGNTASLSNLDLSGWDTSNLEIAGHMFERSGVKEVNLSNWDFHNLKHYNNYGLVDHDGEFRGTEWMFINLLNKCVITMNNISLPDDDNAFSIIDFAGTKPIVVLANGQDGQALPELAALNQQTWKPWNVENEQEITGRQNSNVLTLVKAADPTVKVGERKLNFVFTNQADLENYLNAQLAASQVRSAIGSFGQQWDQQGDTSNGRLKASLRLYPAAGDNFLADWVTPEYQLNTAKPVTPTTPDNPGTTTGNKPGMPGRGGAGTGLNNPRLPGRESAHQAGMNRHATAALPQTGNRDNRSALLGLLALPFLALGALVNRRHEK